MKLSVFFRKLSTPRVQKRLKIGLTVWAGAIIISLFFKFAYDIGHFKAQSVINDKNSAVTATRQILTNDVAQRIISGALKEDPDHPKTLVSQIIDNNQKLSTVIVENNRQKKVVWIIDMHLYFDGDVLNDNGYNLTKSLERQYNIINDNR